VAAGLGHEVNQPLSAVCWQAELAERVAKDGADARALAPMLSEIGEQSHRAAEIVRGLRRMLRHDAPAPSDVDLNEVAAAVMRLLESQVIRGKIEVKLEQGAIPAVIGDHVQLEQVVFNLLQNAIEAVADF